MARERQILACALAFAPARSGYFERMARPRPTASIRVPIGLEVSEADAARIDEVLMRPEFAGWTRAEWCWQIIQSALRYYVGDAPGQGRTRPAVSESAPPAESPSPAPAASVPAPAAPVSPAQPKCPHPSDAWDYETGTCAACGASVGD